MSGNSAVLDSNVIIDDSKGIISINKIFDDYDYLYISIISYVEILGFNFTNNKERTKIENILNNIPIVYLDLKIANIAINYKKKNKIKLADSLILATARSVNADLFTRNIKDFINIDKAIKIIEPKIIKYD
jgi:predicted nucleic acid-binding protein